MENPTKFLKDQGAFDWLDMFKAKHPNYTELSDRSLGNLMGLFRGKVPRGWVTT